MVLQTSCQKEYVEIEQIDIPDTISFAVNVMPIFNESCNSAGCHNAGGAPPELTEENAHFELTISGYVDPQDPEASVLYQRMISTTKPMPPAGKLGESKLQIILNWIEQGALNN